MKGDSLLCGFVSQEFGHIMCSSDGSIGHVVDILHASAGLDELQLLRMNPRRRGGGEACPLACHNEYNANDVEVYLCPSCSNRCSPYANWT